MENKKTEVEGLRNPGLVTIKEAAQMLDRDYQTVQRYVPDVLPAKKYGRFWLIRRSDVDKFSRHKVTAETASIQLGEKVITPKEFGGMNGFSKYKVYRMLKNNEIEYHLVWTEAPSKDPLKVYCFKHHVVPIKMAAEYLDEPVWVVRIHMENAGYHIHMFNGTPLVNRAEAENFIVDNINKVL
jgi:excisionase family DNA binding protein